MATLLVAATAGATLGLFHGCSDGLGGPQCAYVQKAIDSSPLALISRARLDRVGDGFFLLGSDAAGVHWAHIDEAGVMTGEQMAAIPTHIDGPWFAMAGSAAPADHVVIAYTATSTTAPANMVDLLAFAVPVGGGAPTTPVLVAQVPDRTSPVQITMGSGRAGMHAGLAWAVRGTTQIVAYMLGGDGQIAVGTQMLGSVDDFDCLRFSPGKGDLTLGYVNLSGTPVKPMFVGTEIDENGIAQPNFQLTLRDSAASVDEIPGCVEVAPNDRGYALAWHTKRGTYMGVFDTDSRAFVLELVLGDVRIAGDAPPLAGLGYMGTDYALAFDRSSGAEVWRLDVLGKRKGGALLLPSQRSHVGALSTQPAGGYLYGTYADYSSADLTNETAGQRFWVKISCP